MCAMRVLILDNYDSFTYNLHQYVGALGAESLVQKSDAVDLAEVTHLAPDRIILSPGPGRPERQVDFGICGEVIDAFGPKIPILGVCLGHQGVVHRLGGKIVRAPEVFHGKTSLIQHDRTGLFAQLPGRFEVMRYHSLVALESTMPRKLRITARTVEPEPLVMAVQHVEWPLHGIQFHPESVGTPHGMALLKTFLELRTT